MMEVKSNVVAAITAALNLYVEAEQQPGTFFEEKGAPEIPHTPNNPWAISGRQSAMEMRRLWQLRLVR
ncbi:MAG: hypothetical protein AB2L11_08005 [Syntrophobacteraceae bacterium]